MSIAITDDHRALAGTAADFLTKHDARAAARALLDHSRADCRKLPKSLGGQDVVSLPPARG